MIFLNRFKERVRTWALEHALGPRGKFWLVVVAFTESSFFLVPPDLLLIGILLVSAERWFYYASLTTLSSVLGGLFGYSIGYFFFDFFGQAIINFYGLADELIKVGQLFQQNAFWAIFLAAFTPIPYKVFTIASGFFKIDLLTFIIASLLGRAGRFFAVGAIMRIFGRLAGELVYRYFHIFTALVAAAAIIIFVLYLL